SWTARLDPSDGSLALGGDLASLGGGAEGSVDAVATLLPDVRIDGTVVGLGVAGVALGDLALAGDRSAGWRVAGDRVQAEVTADLAGWSLEVRDLALPVGATTLDAAWRRGSQGDVLEARWRGTTPAGAVDLSASLAGAFATGLWRGDVAGEALGGRLAWPIARTADGWSGTAGLDGASYGGVGFVATAELSGAGRWPEVEARAAAADDAWALEGGWVGGAAVVSAEVATPEGRLGVRGRALPELDLIVADARGGAARVRGGWQDAPLRIEGRADLAWGPLALELSAPNRASIRVVGIDGAWTAALPPGGLTAAWGSVRRDGWAWSGEGAWGGELLVARGGALAAEADAATLALGDLDLAVDGALRPGDGALAWRLGGVEAFLGVPTLEGALTWDGATLALTADGFGRVDVRSDTAAARTGWALDLGVGGGRVAGALAWGADGWSGRIDGSDVVLPLPADEARLALSVRGDGPDLALEGTVRTASGVATLAGRWDARPLRLGAWGPTTPPRRELDLRLSAVDLAGLGGARALAGTLAGSIAVRGDLVVGQFVSEALTLGTWRTDALLSLRGDLAGGPEATVRLDVGASRATFEVDPLGLEVFAQLERFPLHDAVAAAFGPSDVLAEVTGVLRGAWSWGAARPHDLRLATEHVRLERAGVVTTGTLALSWDDVALRINEARFEGSGAWSARGSATPEALDLEFVASGADFSPLLGLVPSFARYGVTAAGDLSVRATGTLAAPNVTATTAALELGVAGTRYRLEEVAGELVGSAWSVRAGVAGVAPLGGRVDLVAGGRVGPFPDTGFSLEARAVGDLDVPFLGRITDLDAEVRWSDARAATLVATGAVGGPLSVEGTLSPLDLSARGRSLELSVPFLFVADATADAEARLVTDAEGVRVSGRVDVAEARVDLAARRDAAAATASATPTSDAPAADPAAIQATRARVRFDGVRIVAPQRVAFAESFGSAEAAVDLTLGGDAAAPRLAGTVAALRGTLRFAGRDLELTQAVATFDPTRGVFPALVVGARTTFDKARVVPAGTEVRFTAPPGPSFRVDVAFEGEATGGDEGFALDLEPRLASDALVEGLDAGSGARPLTDLELLSLVALGRLEVTSGFAGTVAQNALDAAVDLLVTAEIQAALAEGLGLDVVELRTTPVTSLFDGGDPFGVSLRLGGYLSDEVFASYRVSTLDGDTAFGAFSNEVAFAYQLGPVAIDLTGRVDVAAGTTATAGPSLGVGASYGFAGGWSLEFGVDLATERSLARLGVTWRW
ncbi:MAG: translocation/assembly module TamB domain-containing protein, partial [Trueperaceae bacterium]|nr:translocation/assembly module TamB domain-containing protein [Trueperaceae bacterium]